MLNRYDESIRALQSDPATDELKYAWKDQGVIYKKQGNIY